MHAHANVDADADVDRDADARTFMRRNVHMHERSRAHARMRAQKTGSAPTGWHSREGGIAKFSFNVSWWAFNLINQYTDLNFQVINAEVRAKAAGLEARARSSVKARLGRLSGWVGRRMGSWREMPERDPLGASGGGLLKSFSL